MLNLLQFYETSSANCTSKGSSLGYKITPNLFFNLFLIIILYSVWYIFINSGSVYKI